MAARAKRATLQQIAEEISLSVSTVSRALNNNGQIDPETRERVQRIADRLGYRQNKGEEGRGREVTMAVITSRASRIDLEAPPVSVGVTDANHIQRMLFTIEQVAQEGGYHVVLNSDTGVPGLLPSSIRTRFAQGALLLGGQFSDATVEQIAAEVPTVFVASFLPSGKVHAVHADYRQGALLAVEHLVALGHRRIGFINGPLDTNTSSEKLAGFLQGCFASGLPIERELILNAENFNPAAGTIAAEQLFAQHSPTAVVAASDVVARGVLHFAQGRGLAVPEQLSVVSLYNDAEDMLYSDGVQLTRVRPQHSLLARVAVERLLTLLGQPATPPVSVVVPVEFSVGTSSGPAAS